MAFDEALAGRLRDALAPVADVVEKRMFGGLAFIVSGHMCVGVVGERLVARLDPVVAEAAIADGSARPMDFTGKPMAGWVFVNADAISGEADLARWVALGRERVAALPPR